MRKSILAVLCAATLVTGCAGMENVAGTGYGGKAVGGAVLGAAGGALLGNQFGRGSGKAAMTAIGAVGGLLLGGMVGNSLDRADQAAMQQQQMMAFAQSYPVGRPMTYSNPRTGFQLQTTPVRDGYSEDGRFCREVRQAVVVGGRVQEGIQRGCQNPDGSWALMASN